MVAKKFFQLILPNFLKFCLIYNDFSTILHIYAILGRDFLELKS